MIEAHKREYRRRILPWVLMVLGAVMVLWSLAMLSQTPNVFQYTILAPEPGENNANINTMLDKAAEVWQSQHSNFVCMTVGGNNGNASLSEKSDGSREIKTANVNLIGMGEGWLEVYPRFVVQGRRISEVELQCGTAVIMLDEDLSIYLFGSILPESAVVKLNEVEFRVVGTVKHGSGVLGVRSVGDAVPYDVYIPLKAAVENSIELETMTISATPKKGAGWSRTFLTGVKQWTADGHMIDLKKEAMRPTILPRILLLIVGLYALVGLFNRLTDVVMGWFERYRQALRLHYFNELIPRLLGLVALTLLCYGALVGLTWLLLFFSVQPMYTFTEWIPNNFVEWSSISKVFWDLISSFAVLVRVGTRELRIVEFWGGFLRWGVILFLLGAALLPKAHRKKKKQ